MSPQRQIVAAALLMLAGGIWSIAVAGQQPTDEPSARLRQPPPPQPGDEPSTPQPRERGGAREVSYEPLVHGPVHEAFAAPTPREAAPSPKLSEVPPEPPEELPPPVAPEADGAPSRWIPGYWGWDAREGKFVWVSGTWRSAPPEMEWVPGYWATQDGECHWVSGFWTRRDAEGLTYVPPPPAPREEQPPPPPDDDHFWVPGNWSYTDREYGWQPGYWARRQEDLVWTPNCYAWTPRGYVFVRGYWDLPPEERGLLLAPLAVEHGWRGRITPTVAINVREALAHWFVAPTYGHYCFGDYYDVDRAAFPLVSWYEYGGYGPRYDAVAAYYAGSAPQLLTSLRTKHRGFAQNIAYRPPLLWRDYRAAGAGAMAFGLAGERLPGGLAQFEFAGDDLAAVGGYYRGIVDRRAQWERGAFLVDGSAPAFVALDGFLPPGHGGFPPGLAKKGLVPPGHGGLPPGQVKKFEAIGPFAEGPGKGKGGGGGKGKGKGR